MRADGCRLHHFDFYRLKSSEELYGAGYEDCLAEGGIMVEWGDKFPEALPAGDDPVAYRDLAEGRRRIRGARTS